jgi:hypothetical protein
MGEPDTLGAFFRENKDLLQEYVETKLEIIRLVTIRKLAKSAGFFAWALILLFLAFFILLFGGLVLAFWLSELTGSLLKGFSAAGGILLVIFGLVAIFRKPLFMEPVSRIVISHATEDFDEQEPGSLPGSL